MISINIPGTSTPMRRDRPFADYARFWEGSLEQTILERTQFASELYVWDLGCGEGNAARDYGSILSAYARSVGAKEIPNGLLNYIGVDLVAGSNWDATSRARFFEGDIADVCSQEGISPMDIGISCCAMPYVADKLGAVFAMLRKLSDKGSLFIQGFLSSQIILDGKPLAHADLEEILPNNVKFSWSGPQLRIEKTRPFREAESPIRFQESKIDEFYMRKHWWVGNPGVVSRYSSQ